MLLSSICVFVAFIAFAKAQLFELGGCPENIPVQQYFDPQSFAGRWYEQKHTGRVDILEATAKCVYFDFSDEIQGVVNIESLKVGIFLGEKRFKEETIKVSEPGHYESSDYDYRIASTDYETYAIAYACSKIFIAHATLVWIFTRQREMVLEQEIAIMEKLKDLGIPSDGLMKTSQTGCEQYD